MSPIPSAVAGLIEGRADPAYLTTWVRDRPRVAPVWYGVRDGRLQVLVSRTKREQVEANPEVTAYIEATDGEDWFVTLRGTASVSRDREAINEAARQVYSTYLGDDPEDWDPDRRVDLGLEPERYLVELDPGEVEAEGADVPTARPD
ncbi:MAG: pyridoxamine 5'-phosphate oxidase family protein [Halanaeroarchaeum sp.]